MNVVLDTNVFLDICRGSELEGKVKSKIIRDCDIVSTNDELIEEYSIVLGRFGLTGRIIFTNLSIFDVYGKYRHGKNSEVSTDLITHEKDRHIVECAVAYSAAIITHEFKHLLNLKDELYDSFGLRIYSPEEYLSLPKS